MWRCKSPGSPSAIHEGAMGSAEHPQALCSLLRAQVPPVPGLRGVKVALWTPVSAGDSPGATESGSNMFYHRGKLATSMEPSGGDFFPCLFQNRVSYNLG